MKCSIAFALLNLAYFAGIAQYYPVPPRIDPAKKRGLLTQIHAARHDEAEVGALLQLSCIYYHYPLKQQSDLDQALSLADQAGSLSIRLHDEAGIDAARFYKGEIFIAARNMAAAEGLLAQVDDTTRLKLLLNLSVYNDFNSNTLPDYASKAAAFAQQALTLATRLGRKAEENEAWLNIANIQLVDMAYGDCGKSLKKILADSSSKHFSLLRYGYITYCLLSLYEGNYDKGLYYSLKAIGTIADLTDSLQAGDCFLALAETYYLIENNNLSLDFSKKALAAYSLFAGEGRIIDAVDYAVMALTKTKRYQQAHQFLEDIGNRYPPQNENDKLQYLSYWAYLYKGEKKYAQAEPYYLRILKTAEADHLEDESVYRNMGDVLVQDHKYAEAKPYLVKALNLHGGNKSLRIKSLVNYYLFLCDSAAGNYTQAIRELSIAGDLNNQIKDTAKNQQLQALQIQYETKQRERELEIKDQNILLLQRKNQIQQDDLIKSKLVRRGTLIGIGILLVLLIVSVGYYRQKQKTNRIISRKNLTITQKNEQLERLIIDKDWLLKEVHHRVKNNLHTVICLLESQAMYLENDALKAIEVSQHRIYAMSLIHQKIYQADDIRTIDMANYLPEFIGYLAASFGEPSNIQFQLAIEPVKLDVSQAIPIALIVNEAVTNAIKYAFPDRRPGVIAIRLRQLDGHIQLTVTDDGVGMDAPLNDNEPDSLGIQLMKGLAQEIKGTISFATDRGRRGTHGETRGTDGDGDTRGTDRGTRISLIFDADALYGSHDAFIGQPPAQNRPC